MTSAEDARLQGYTSVTRPYGPDETPLLNAALKQFTGATVVLVETARGPEIWRLKSELRSGADDVLSATEAKRREHYGR